MSPSEERRALIVLLAVIYLMIAGFGLVIPLLPFFAGLVGLHAIYGAAAVTVCSLFGIGVILSLFTGHSAVRGGLRLMLIGSGAGVAAWAVGSVLGTSL